MENQRIYIAGKEIADIEGISLRGIFYGEGIFETMRWNNSPPVFLDRHIDRILYGASVLEMPEPDGGKIITEITGAVEKTGFGDCAVKVCLISGGVCSPFFAKPDSFQTIISVREFPENSQSRDIKIICENKLFLKNPSPLSGIKSLNYLENILAMRKAKQKGFDEALFLDKDGFVSETACCNIFWGANEKIFTPSSDCGILSGITRGVLMEIAHQNGLTVSEAQFSPESIAQSDFVFVTNSLVGMVPVKTIQLQDLTLTFDSFNADSYLNLKSLLFQTLKWK